MIHSYFGKEYETLLYYYCFLELPLLGLVVIVVVVSWVVVVISLIVSVVVEIVIRPSSSEIPVYSWIIVSSVVVSIRIVYSLIISSRIVISLLIVIFLLVVLIVSIAVWFVVGIGIVEFSSISLMICDRCLVLTIWISLEFWILKSIGSPTSPVLTAILKI